jgi:2-polyprenyl-6-methoxyphenol hydroxylase-like FAD-dependent oxidoreductase
MKTVCIGGGPAGLYFAISAKLRDAGHDITVIERDPAGATYGWGVVYWDDLLDILFRNDLDSAQRIRAASVLWQEQRVILRSEQTAYLPGYGFSVGRATLLDILGERATDLGVDVQYRREVTDTSTLTDADLVVICDGANSRLRQRHRDHFGTRADSGGNPYIWLGTDKVFDSFTFAFEQTSVGWIWFHAYPSSSGISTCIVECTQPTWLALGFDSLSSEDSAALLEKLRARPRRPCADQPIPQRTSTLAALYPRDQQNLVPRQPGPGRRCRPHHAFHPGIGHQAGDDRRRHARPKQLWTRPPRYRGAGLRPARPRSAATDPSRGA